MQRCLKHRLFFQHLSSIIIRFSNKFFKGAPSGIEVRELRQEHESLSKRGCHCHKQISPPKTISQSARDSLQKKPIDFQFLDALSNTLDAVHDFFYYSTPVRELPVLNTLPWNAMVCRGCLKSWLLFQHPREFKIKSLYSNDLILNIASKSKETGEHSSPPKTEVFGQLQLRCRTRRPLEKKVSNRSITHKGIWYENNS